MRYQAKYITVDSLGQIHTKTNDWISALSIAEQFNFEIKKWVVKAVFGTGRNKKVIEGHYKTIREIDNSGQLSLLEVSNGSK